MSYQPKLEDFKKLLIQHLKGHVYKNDSETVKVMASYPLETLDQPVVCIQRTGAVSSEILSFDATKRYHHQQFAAHIFTDDESEAYYMASSLRDRINSDPRALKDKGIEYMWADPQIEVPEELLTTPVIHVVVIIHVYWFE